MLAVTTQVVVSLTVKDPLRGPKIYGSQNDYGQRDQFEFILKIPCTLSLVRPDKHLFFKKNQYCCTSARDLL